MKRFLYIVLFLILSAAGGYYYYSNQKPNFTRDSAAYKAIPVSAPFFFEVSSVKAVDFNNPMIAELKSTETGNTWIGFLQKADSVVSANNSIPGRILSKPFILTWGFTGRNQMVPLFITKAESASGEKALENFIKTIYTPSTYRYNEKAYGTHTINEVVRSNGEGPLYYSFVDGLFLASTKIILVEQVILQMTTRGIVDNPYFKEVSQAAGAQGITLYINHSQTDGFFENFISGKSIEKTDEFGSRLRVQPIVQALKFNGLAGWSELDFHFENENLLLSGVSSADDSLNHFLSVFNEQQPIRLRADEVLPANTSFFCSYSFSDKDAFFSRLEDYYMHTSGFYYREERMKRFDRGIRGSLRGIFTGLVKNEVVVATGTIPVNPANKNVYFLMQINSGSEAEEQIKNLITGYAARTENEVSEYISKFSVDNEVSYPVYRFPYPSFPGLWLGNPFLMADARYITFYNGYIVFANSESGIHEYLRSMTLGTTLSKNKRYQQFREKSPSRSNMNVFADINRSFSYRDQLFSEELLKQMKSNEENIRKFRMVNWQVRRDKSTYINSLAVSMSSAAEDEAQTTWQSVVGNELRMKPQILINHTDRSAQDIVFQDKQNMLYQVSSSGRVRWSVQLPGTILSDIHQIDYYHNGRYQYFFNTKDNLYLIDRNGNNVAHFPVSLPSPATNGVNVFDYDNNRNYRYFVSGEDKKIYVFDREAKIVKGWNFDSANHEVTTPVQHFRIAAKDYIVFKDKTTIYILNRQGEDRISVTSRFENSKNPLFLNVDEEPKLVASDKNGTVYFIYFDGRIEEKKTARFSEEHLFTSDDLDGDGLAEFIFADGNELSVFNEKGKRLFSRKFNGPLLHRPNIYTFSENLKKIGITDASSNRIYLLDAEGKLHDGFPLQGNSEFSIGRLSENSEGLNLIVGSEGGLLFNYTIH